MEDSYINIDFQVSRTWKVLAEDEVLWYRLCQGEGYLLDMSISDHSCWKLALKNCRAREHMLKTNWKVRGNFPGGFQMLGKNGNLVPASGRGDLVLCFAPPLSQLKAAGEFWGWMCLLSVAVAKLGVLQQQILGDEGMGAPPPVSSVHQPTPVSSLQNRVGAVSQLRYEPGRVLCDVHCCDGVVMAG